MIPRKPSQGQPLRKIDVLKIGNGSSNGAPTSGPNGEPLASSARRNDVGGDASAGAPTLPSTARGAVSDSKMRATGTDENAMSPAEASQVYGSCLSQHEQSEILDYNNIYYCGANCKQKIPAPVADKTNFGFDDERGDFTIVQRDHIAYRYEVLNLLGKGSFGQVVKAIDHKTGSNVAVKIIRNKKRFHTQAQVEVKVLNHLNARDPEGKYGIIRLIENFTFRNHWCLTYELLSINLYEHMKMNRFHPMPLNVVKKIGASLLISLAFMWRENIIHCDLKPENIMLRQPNRTGIKVIDLGSACFESERIYTYIQSRFYRAPEIILGRGYTRRIDLWSFACVLAELATGYPLFAGESEQEQLLCMMEVLGVPSREIISTSPRRSNFFSDSFAPILVPNSRKKVREPSTKSLHGVLGLDETDPFVEFLRMFLQYDPYDRPTPEGAMRHPWICDAYVGVTPKIPTNSRTRKSKGNDSSRRESQPNSNKDDHQQTSEHQPKPPQSSRKVSDPNSGNQNDGSNAPATSGGGGGGLTLPDIHAKSAR